VRVHRRGHAGSDGFSGRFSIEDQARDLVAVLQHLDIDKAHVVGHSYGGAIAVQLALDASTVVHSLVLIEPAIFNLNPRWHGAQSKMFAPLQELRRQDAAAAAARFMRGAEGPDWMSGVEAASPGGLAQVEHDAATVFDVELPAMERWQFGEAEARRISQPVLYIAGTQSLAFRPATELRDLFASCVPQTVFAEIPDADHSLHHRKSGLVATELAAFLGCHPIS
jgi:pimeloyl-ACP methyl ester carboxylesterase